MHPGYQGKTAASLGLAFSVKFRMINLHFGVDPFMHDDGHVRKGELLVDDLSHAYRAMMA
jgi:hypothetical protein